MSWRSKPISSPTKPLKPHAMDLRQFRYFVALKEFGSFSAAAESLGITQPSLSEFIRRLEADLETALVARSPRGIELTEAGDQFAKHGAEILERVRIAREAARRLGLGSRSSVEVGMPAVLSGILSVPLAETVQLQFPGKKIVISECPSGIAVEMVRKGGLDFGIGYQNFDLKGDVYARPLMDEKLFILASPNTWDVETDAAGIAIEPVQFVALRGKPLVMTNQNSAWRRTIEHYAESHGLVLSPDFEIDSLSSLISLVVRGRAIAIAPQSAAFREAARGELVLIPFSGPEVSVRSFTIRSQGRPVSQFSLAVEDLVAQTLRDNILGLGLHARVLRAQHSS